MKAFIASATLAIGLMTAAGAYAKIAEIPAPASAPAGSTGICNDGSFTTTTTKSGACQGHKGVQNWYTSASAATAVTTTAKAAVPATTAASAPAATAKTAAAATGTAAAAGGGAGQVWVNSKSNVYHCFGTKYYGKTKAGQYMTEAAAKAAGAHPDHGKACS